MFEEIRRTAFLTLLLCLGVTGVAWGQEEAEDPDGEVALGMSNSTELSFVLTEGNSNTDALGFKNRYRYIWPSSRYTFRVEATRTNTADDRIAVVALDLDSGYRIVEFSKSPDVEKYLVENRYDRAITERFFWNVGLTWDRNLDAGIASRWIGFAGVGNVWWDREDLMFNTSYGLSYTDREEVDADPTKEDTFFGYRFNWEYLNLWGKNTTFENRWTFNGSFAESSDWNSDMTTAVSVGINSRLALRVSLQWLYNNVPALQDLDLFVLTPEGDLIQVPDRVIQEPKEKLDTIFNTSLVVNF
jgi:putative salt-induced outer membrane protein YdiY